MQSFLCDDMAEDQQARSDVAGLKRAVEETNNRSLRLGEKLEALKDFAHRDINVRTVRVEERATVIMSVVGFLIAGCIAAGTQLYVLNGRISGIDSDVRNITSTVNAIRLKQISSTPNDPQSIKDVGELLAKAQSRQIQIDAATIKDAGGKFVEVSQTNPAAWTAVADFLAYHSYLNLLSVPTGRLRRPDKAGQSTYSAKNVLNFPNEIVNWMGYSDFPNVAQFRGIGDPDLNFGKSGPAFLVFERASVLLDGMHVKRVIFRNGHIIYKGGVVELDTVYFVNCTFDIVREPNGLRLAEQVLSSPVTTAQLGT